MKYSYKRTWQSEVANSVVVLAFTNALAALLIYLASDDAFLIGPTVVIVGFITLIDGAHIYSAAKLKKNFICTISDTDLKCIRPDPHFGESFRLAIVDLSVIEVEDGRVKLRMQNGSEHWFTSNYGNPTGYFINLLLEANPNSKLVHT